MVAAGIVAAATMGFATLPATAGEGTDGGADVLAVAQRAGEAWLAGVQQPGGGYAVAGFAGVETPEAVLAHAVQAQTSDVWSEREAIDAVEALGPLDGGPTVLDALGELARATATPVDAALLITRVALPLGLDPTVFDPANQGRPVDLVALMDDATAEDSVSVMSEVVVARVSLGEDPPEPLVTAIVEAALPDGGWAAPGEDSEIDVATTALAVVALTAAGSPVGGDPVGPALSQLTVRQNDDGGWGPGEESQAVDTAAAMSALRATGFDPDEGCWREGASEASAGRPSPSSHLVETQAEAGNWGSGGEAVSTAVALQALSGRRLPLARAETQTCGGGLSWPLPDVPPTFLIVVAIGAVGAFGAARILRSQRSAF